VIDLLKIVLLLIVVLRAIQVKGLQSMVRLAYVDYKHKLVNWRWLWTAITRAKQVDDVCFARYNNNKYAKLNNNTLRSYVDTQNNWAQSTG
jgi:hypothetical protein